MRDGVWLNDQDGEECDVHVSIVEQRRRSPTLTVGIGDSHGKVVDVVIDSEADLDLLEQVLAGAFADFRLMLTQRGLSPGDDASR